MKTQLDFVIRLKLLNPKVKMLSWVSMSFKNNMLTLNKFDEVLPTLQYNAPNICNLSVNHEEL